jgi:hypothetical protein
MASNTTPRTPSDFRERAESCERFAEGSVAPDIREAMLYLAQQWRALADTDEERARSNLEATAHQPACD